MTVMMVCIQDLRVYMQIKKENKALCEALLIASSGSEHRMQVLMQIYAKRVSLDINIQNNK